MLETEYLREIVLKMYNVPAEVLDGRQRTPEECTPRFAYWFLLRHVAQWSSTRIGKFVQRDHTTILHGVKTFEARGGRQYFNIEELSALMFADRVSKIPKKGDVAPVNNLLGTGGQPVE